MRDAVNIDGEGERVDLLAQRERISRYRFSGSRDGAVHRASPFTFTVFSNSNKTPFCSTSRVSPRRQRAGYISLHFSAKDNDDDNDEDDDNDDDEPSLEERCGLTAFFLLPVRDALPLCLLEWKLDSLSFLLLLPFSSQAHPGIEKEPRTFICNVSRFRLKSPFQSTSCSAVVSYVCQKALLKLFQAARSVASFGSRTI